MALVDRWVAQRHRDIDARRESASTLAAPFPLPSTVRPSARIRVAPCRSRPAPPGACENTGTSIITKTKAVLIWRFSGQSSPTRRVMDLRGNQTHEASSTCTAAWTPHGKEAWAWGGAGLATHHSDSGWPRPFGGCVGPQSSDPCLEWRHAVTGGAHGVVLVVLTRLPAATVLGRRHQSRARQRERCSWLHPTRSTTGRPRGGSWRIEEVGAAGGRWRLRRLTRTTREDPQLPPRPQPPPAPPPCGRSRPLPSDS